MGANLTPRPQHETPPLTISSTSRFLEIIKLVDNKRKTCSCWFLDRSLRAGTIDPAPPSRSDQHP